MNAFLWFLLPMAFMVFIFGLDSSNKLKRMQGRIKSLERKRKGNKTMSQFLKRNDWKEADNYERVNWNQ